MTEKHTATSHGSGENNICRHDVRNSKQENTCADTVNDRGNLGNGYKVEDGNAGKDKIDIHRHFSSDIISEASGLLGGESCSFNDLQVTWMDGSTSMNPSDDVVVVDRGFLLGDLVASSMDTTGQVGRVMNIDITVDLLAPTGKVVKNVSSRDLKRVREFACGDYVVNGNWLGRVHTVLDDVSVLFDDGSLCRVPKASCSLLKPVSKVITEDPTFPYYPGLRVRATSPSVFKECTWLSGLWKVNSLEGTVTKVQIGSVSVQWIASAIDLSPVRVPSEEQDPKDLMLLSCFAHTNWRLGDCCLVPQLLASTFAVDSSLTRISKEQIQHCMLKMELLTEDAIGENVAGSFESSKECNHEYMVTANTKEDITHMDEAVLSKECKFAELSPNPLPNSVSHHLRDCYCADYSLLQKDSGTYQISHSNMYMLETNEKERSEVSDACFEAGFCSGSVSVSKQHGLPSSFYQRGLQNLLLDHGKKKEYQETENSELVFLITNTRTRVDVIWQDGTRHIGLDSVSLIPVENPGDYELFPEQYVVDASNEGVNASESRRIGVVRSMNSKERTVNIRWLKNLGEPQHLIEEEVASVYELYAHPDYDYCYGDVVTRLPSVSVSTDSAILQNFDEEKGFNYAKGKCDIEISSLDKGHASDGPFSGNAIGLSCFGHITDLKDGNIEVAWGNGEISKNGPQEIYVVGRETDGEILADESDLSGDEGWEDDGESMIAYGSAEQDYFSPSSNETHIDKAESLHEGSSQSKGGPLSIAVQYIATLASGFLSLGLNEGISSSHMTELQYAEEGQDITDYERQVASTTATTQTTRAGTSRTFTKLRMDEKLDNNEMEAGMNLEAKNKFDTCELDEFSHFDISKDPFDHHFFGGSVQTHCGGKWAKRIQREWAILEKNLPDAVFVKVFEDRMDLLRAVITGACGTPYHDGLFFFDFCFPPEFPQVPPTAYYHSKGVRINPNLYEDGTVCLSLLNTWKGKGNEVWDPSSSSILQVLISLQGLVLNSKPYFNEPGYEKHMGSFEGERNSLSYNENTFLLNLKSMIYIMQNPPMHFEKFVEVHFRKRGPHILNACDAYLKGCLAGSLTENTCCEDESREKPCSAGFKLILAKITPKLFSALKDAGAKCDEFKHLTSSS